MLTSQATNMSLFEGFKAATTAYTTAFDGFYVAKQPGYYETYTKRNSNTGSQILDQRFASNLPQMRKMGSTRQEKYARTHQMAARIETWEATMVLDRKLVQYNGGDMGLIGGLIRDYLAQAQHIYDQAVVAEFDSVSGASSTCFDGLALFSASHVFGAAGATWSNFGTSNLNWINFDAARQAMREFKLENGEPAGMNPTHLRVGPKLERMAKEILEAKERIRFTSGLAVDSTTAVVNATPFTNIWAGELELIVDTRITNYYWTLMDLSKPGMRPMEIYEGMAPTPQIIDGMTADSVYTRDAFTYGLLSDFVVYPGHPLTCYRNAGTAVG